MRAERDDARVILEYLRGTVALVHVQVETSIGCSAPANRSGNFLIAFVAATAMSLKTQKPSPLSLNAWWVPPAICAAHLAVVPARRTSCVAATVPPVDASERVTCDGFIMGKPMARPSFSVSAHPRTRVT